MPNRTKEGVVQGWRWPESPAVDSPCGMDVVGAPDPQVWCGRHAGLGVPGREAADRAVLQGAASSSCFGTAPCAGEALVAAGMVVGGAFLDLLVRLVQRGLTPHLRLYG